MFYVSTGSGKEILVKIFWEMSAHAPERGGTGRKGRSGGVAAAPH